ncbi:MULTISPECIES: hypothetical protein [unclassified Acinetobacter]|uniref:hypothetical protein n=1 Tax=unclassified Acinetobacter TaxID=196816 RepID=UPI002934358C|nr:MULTISPECIES: hypothetical protein [unclassified Acinetobacter]WOE31792.1 hypothetical protein QSG84_00800 [Acinetobacter sp. SAAs470]WOE37259.1 hypothetical protein QSG86_09845 [Acinetobacter sp. SAAs474]
MNFKYFSFSISLLFVMMLVIILITMLGNQFLTKTQLEMILYPLFFLSFGIIGYFIAQKAPMNQYRYAMVMALIIVAFIALFLDVIKQIPQQLWQLLLAIWLSLQIGILMQYLSHKWLKK